ncbi:hypothetical protein CEXT_660271 [Caerostris extrusa]|uniref:Uncharacterized protein n=1 Tax=Caerostris extrusa TaxID=172846 RepID=A0AAV4N0T4_CAEEX|nr:hypothetical protein CEXT_660271 [Caerostris extrusa]
MGFRIRIRAIDSSGNLVQRRLLVEYASVIIMSSVTSATAPDSRGTAPIVEAPASEMDALLLGRTRVKGPGIRDNSSTKENQREDIFSSFDENICQQIAQRHNF